MYMVYMPRTVNFRLSNSLIATQNYVNKDKVSSHNQQYAVPVNSFNNPPENEFSGPARRPRPLKHYRKRLMHSNTSVSKVSLNAFEVPGGITRADNLSDNCSAVAFENHKLVKLNC